MRRVGRYGCHHHYHHHRQCNRLRSELVTSGKRVSVCLLCLVLFWRVYTKAVHTHQGCGMIGRIRSISDVLPPTPCIIIERRREDAEVGGAG